MYYAVKSFEQLTNTIYRAILQPASDKYVEYQAGQYIEILQPGSAPQPFSIANAPLSSEHLIELDIRHYPDNVYTGAILKEIQTKKQLQLRGPFGKCILQQEPAWPLFFLAGGAGIAPIKALIEQAKIENIARPVYLYWGARIIADFYLHDLILDWTKSFNNFHYFPVLSGKNELTQWTGKTGWVHNIVINEHPKLSEAHVYVSGPIGMAYAVLHTLKENGLDQKFIYSDMF